MKTSILRRDKRLFYAINGKPIPGIFCSTPVDYMKNFIDAGFRVFDTHPFTPLGWMGPDEYDYAETDSFIESYLSQKPDALLILRFWMGYSVSRKEKNFWWQDAHPDELILTSRGDRGLVVPKSPSFASHKFRRDAGVALRKVIEHIEAKYGNNVLMYEPGGGTWGEWFHWFAYYFGDMNDRENLEDYSAPMRAEYASFLEKKYGTLPALNLAHRRSYSNFGEAPLPQIDERYHARHGILRSTFEERPVLDFYEMWNDLIASTLCDWAEQIKLGCGGNKLVGAYYGYLWNHHSMGQPLARSGHTALDAVYSCPHLDVIGAPFGYSFRQMGGVTSSQAMVGSASARGKQFLHEFDNSTHIASGWACPDHHNPENAEETGELFKRELCRVLMDGSSCLYMDLFGGMYNDPGVIQELAAVLKTGNQLYDEVGHNNRQVAVVMNARDSHYFEEENLVYMAFTMMFKQFELERMGLSFDDFILEDLDHLTAEDTAKYKLWIFPSLVHVTKAHAARIKEHCFRAGNVVLWNYAVGVAEEGSRESADQNAVKIDAAPEIPLDPMRELTGFDCGYTMIPGELTVRVRDAEAHAVLKNVPPELKYGTQGDLSPDAIRLHASKDRYVSSEEGFAVAPRFFINNAEVVLGHLEDFPESGTVGLGLKRMDTWTSVLSTAPLVPASILRSLARLGGAHVYTDFLGQTAHCEGFLSFYAHASGEAAFHLPEEAAVTEVFGGTLVGRVKTFTFPVKENCTYLFRLT